MELSGRPPEAEVASVLLRAEVHVVRKDPGSEKSVMENPK
jgi:hypothetical protein